MASAPLESWHFCGAHPGVLSGNESLDLLRVGGRVREASHGRLPGVLPTVPTQPQLLLLSTVHLCSTDHGPWYHVLTATWCVPLEAKQTVPMPFLCPEHSPCLVPTVTRHKYSVDSFKTGIFWPLERVLDPPIFLELLRRAARTPPRAIPAALPCLRLGRAVDVVILVHGRVVVHVAWHWALLALNEADVEAAGAKAASLAHTGLVLEDLRPFLFILWHDDGNVALLMGCCSDPQP
ncbi:LOW QUALITY PROTEIN: plasma protease C1 inhibitor [Indicator indicator]|uniref:LOW QUALITY PROTEIN: plasma protease C1 inhibitor n=1 Tax=Indicator indicator TaxID=1002788 RepID=UPI0023DFDCD9|nr:LOW QUALITY PROTEIN: plasma protease C1 inhibitor [Indicator indicator]